jgi:dihydrofolate reductase
LLDELRVWVHPVFVGRGTTLFREGGNAAFRLLGVETLATGVAVLTYQPTGA